jgi:hypothetical protein
MLLPQLLVIFRSTDPLAHTLIRKSYTMKSLTISRVNVERVFEVTASASIIRNVGNQLHIDKAIAREDLIVRERVSKQVTNGSKTAVMDVVSFLCVSLGSSTL